MLSISVFFVDTKLKVASQARSFSVSSFAHLNDDDLVPIMHVTFYWAVARYSRITALCLPKFQ